MQVLVGIWIHFLGDLGPPVRDDVGRDTVIRECNAVALEAPETTLFKLEQNCGRFLGRLEGPSIPDKTEVGRDAGAVDGGVEEACGTP